MTWFTEYRVRTLAERIAPRILPSVSAAVAHAIGATIAAELPVLLMDELRREIPEYTPKRNTSFVRDRNNAMRASFTGRNHAELSARFGVSIKQVRRIVAL